MGRPDLIVILNDEGKPETVAIDDPRAWKGLYADPIYVALLPEVDTSPCYPITAKSREMLK